MATDGAVVKRQKIRKGTFSCWECKRRKKRCQFGATSHSVCENCRRVGAQCIGQDAEEPTKDSHWETERRLTQMEALVADFERQRNGHRSKGSWPEVPGSRCIFERSNVGETSVGNASAGVQERRSEISRAAGPFALLRPPPLVSRSSRCSMLGDYIESIFPTAATANAIVFEGKSPLAVLETSKAISMPDSGPRVNNCHKRPLRLARSLIQLALCMERLDLSNSKAVEEPLEGSVGVVARQYVDAAHQVTGNDSFIDSLESLEILMLESSFELSTGNARGAWLSVRRALNIAQLMYSGRTTIQAGERENLVRLRLVLFDRVLSLLLGTSYETSITDQWMPSHSASKGLEYEHARISGQIIQRNLRMQQRLQGDGGLSDGYGDYEQTRTIDLELRRAVQSFGSFKSADIRGMKTADATKYVDQMHHYELLVLTHLPYLITGTHLPECAIHNINFEYSSLVAHFASREVLSRVLVCAQSPHIPKMSGALTHKTFISCIALLLTHLFGHTKGCHNSLIYQRLPDREMISEIINEMSHLSEAKRGSFDARVLVELMAIEQEANNGNSYVVRTIGASQKDIQHRSIRLEFALPYLGTIQILSPSLNQLLMSDLEERQDLAAVLPVSFDTLRDPQQQINAHYSNAFRLRERHS